jgi:hypothetical protein
MLLSLSPRWFIMWWLVMVLRLWLLTLWWYMWWLVVVLRWWLLRTLASRWLMWWHIMVLRSLHYPK